MDIYFGAKKPNLNIMVPTDCKNNCPFCFYKQNYSVHPPQKEAILSKIEHLSTVCYATQPSKKIEFGDIYITGGEPLADLSDTADILHKIKKSGLSFERVIIKSSFPVTDYYQMNGVVAFLKEFDYISSLDISRHMDIMFSNQSVRDKLLDKLVTIKPKIRDFINIHCIIPEGGLTRFQAEDIDEFVQSTFPYSIVFVKDQNFIDPSNLNVLSGSNFNVLDGLFGYSYTVHPNCIEQIDFFGGKMIDACSECSRKISYHRKLKETAIHLSSYTIIHELTIRQDGELMYDNIENSVVNDADMIFPYLGSDKTSHNVINNVINDFTTIVSTYPGDGITWRNSLSQGTLVSSNTAVPEITNATATYSNS